MRVYPKAARSQTALTKLGDYMVGFSGIRWFSVHRTSCHGRGVTAIVLGFVIFFILWYVYECMSVLHVHEVSKETRRRQTLGPLGIGVAGDDEPPCEC